MTKRRTTYEAAAPETIRALSESVSRLTMLVERLLGREAEPASLAEDRAAAPVNVATSRKARKLTKREREVARLIAAGLSNEKIAEELFISYETVRAHRASCFKKLGVHNVEDLLERPEAFQEPTGLGRG